jgi:hypothetical protein
VVQEHGLPLEEYHRAGHEITNGNPEVYKALYSRQDDVTLANRSAHRSEVGQMCPQSLMAPQEIIATARSLHSRTSQRS